MSGNYTPEKCHTSISSIGNIADCPLPEIMFSVKYLMEANCIQPGEIDRLVLYGRCLEAVPAAWALYISGVIVPLIDFIPSDELKHLFNRIKVHRWDPNSIEWVTGAVYKIESALELKLGTSSDSLFPEELPPAVKGFVIQNQVLYRYEGNDSIVTIPDQVIGIADGAFSDNSSITQVVIPDSVISIGKNAFQNCTALSEISFRSSLHIIASEAFSKCTALQKVVIPFSVSILDEKAFWGCSDLIRVECMANISELCSGTFAGCANLQYASFSESVKNMERHAFDGCISLSELIFPNPNIDLSHIDFNDLPLLADEQGFICIHGTCYAYVGNDPHPCIPEGITKIAPAAFWKSQITEITLPNSLTVIGGNAFAFSQLSSVSISKSIANIGSCAFRECHNLRSVFFDDNIDSLPIPEESIFYACDEIPSLHISPKLMKLVGKRQELPAVKTYLSSISDYSPECQKKWKRYLSGKSNRIKYAKALRDTDLYEPFCHIIGSTEPEKEEIKPVPEWKWAKRDDGTVEIIKYQGNSTSVTVPEFIDSKPVTAIGDYAFSSFKHKKLKETLNAIKEVYIPDSVEKLGWGVFQDCKAIEVIYLPAQLLQLGWCVFEGCINLKEIDIPGSCRSIPERAFYRCKSLEKCTLHDGLRSIGNSAFYYCESLKEIRFPHSMDLDIQAWKKDNSDLPDAYIVSRLLQSQPIGEYAFCGCKSLTSFSFPKGTTHILRGTLSRCSSLEEINLPETVLCIMDNALRDCTSLADLSLPCNLQHIGSWAFMNDIKLTKLSIPESCISIDDSAFQGCGYQP